MKMLLFVLAALATALPEAYQIELENDWVRVTRVRYAPLVKLPAHPHTSFASAYVYLNDAGPVIFRHVGEKTYAVTRPPTTAGSIRLFRGLEEMHEVENTADTASEFLRVEMKTDPVDPRTLRGRYHRQPVPHGGRLDLVQFENAQVRITRLVRPPAEPLVVAAESVPALVISLAGEPAGTSRWVRAGERVTMASDRDPLEVLRFDLLTQPLPPSRR